MNISSFLNNLKEWAQQNEDIKSIILVGSYARGEEREGSDVDLVIITTSPQVYLNNRFIDKFGTVEKFKKEDWGRVTSIRVWYANNGLEVEFGVTTPLWVEKPLDKGTFRVLSDGYKVIVDKEGYFKDII